MPPADDKTIEKMQENVDKFLKSFGFLKPCLQYSAYFCDERGNVVDNLNHTKVLKGSIISFRNDELDLRWEAEKDLSNLETCYYAEMAIRLSQSCDSYVFFEGVAQNEEGEYKIYLGS